VGTTFEIYLPAMAAEMEIAAPSASAPPRGSNELVLLVDDEPNIRTMVQKALSAHNYRVLVASDGAEASAVFARNISEIKLVITDLDMPYMNGLSLARTLQRMKPDIKILVSSGLGSAKDAKQWGAELAALGIPPILPKPYSTEVLLITLKRLLTDGGGDATEAEATTG
jgi:DNA-binding response OmpR family regulator